MNLFKKLTILLLVADLAGTGFVVPAQAATIGTQQVIDRMERSQDIARVGEILDREFVRAQLVQWGVSTEEAMRRVQALTDEELAQLRSHIDDLPAGAGVLEIIGIVFIVLLILEVVGVIDIFKRR